MNISKLKDIVKFMPNVYVCSLDHLKNLILHTEISYFIVNIYPSYIVDIGHWILIYRTKEHFFMYDSLNWDYSLNDFLDTEVIPINCIRHQALESDMCSFFVLYVLKLLYDGHHISDVMKTLSKNYDFNEKMISKCIYDWFDQ